MDEYSDFTFDNAGRLVSKKENKRWTITYEYDENGRVVYRTEKDSTDLYGPYRYTFTYNDSGELVSYVEHDNFKNEIAYSYEYDSHNRVVKEVKKWSDGDTSESIYIYNNKGDVAGSESYNYKHDNLGRTIEKTNTNGTFRIKYEYEIAGYLDASPETNPELLTPDKWVSIEGAYGLPSPDSCVSTIVPASSVDGLVFMVAQSDTGWMNPDFKYEHIQDGEKREYRKYQLILSELCGFDLEIADDGVISISKDGVAVAEMDYRYDDQYGFCIVLDLVN
jgi:YD repeat-containing protein